MNAKAEENKYGVKFSQLHSVEMADINGDGLLDIVTGKRFWAHGAHGDVEVSFDARRPPCHLDYRSSARGIVTRPPPHCRNTRSACLARTHLLSTFQLQMTRLLCSATLCPAFRTQPPLGSLTVLRPQHTPRPRTCIACGKCATLFYLFM